MITSVVRADCPVASISSRPTSAEVMSNGVFMSKGDSQRGALSARVAGTAEPVRGSRSAAAPKDPRIRIRDLRKATLPEIGVTMTYGPGGAGAKRA